MARFYTKYAFMRNEELVRRFLNNTTTELEAELIHRLNLLMEAYDEKSDELQDAEDALRDHGIVSFEYFTH